MERKIVLSELSLMTLSELAVQHEEQLSVPIIQHLIDRLNSNLAKNNTRYRGTIEATLGILYRFYPNKVDKKFDFTNVNGIQFDPIKAEQIECIYQEYVYGHYNPTIKIHPLTIHNETK